MKREQIMALEARELDGAVAEHVMGWTKVHETDEGPIVGRDPQEQRGQNVLTTIPRYSTDIATAWQVVEALEWPVRLERFSDGQCECGVFLYEDTEDEYDVWVVAPTAPEAICKAALLASDVRASKRGGRA